MNIIGPVHFQDLFHRHIDTRVKKIIPNIDRFLEGWTLWLGMKPPGEGPNTNGNYTDPERRNIYIPVNNVIPDSDNDEIAQMLNWFHEGCGHVIHLALFGYDVAKWQDWADNTGHALDLSLHIGGGSGLAYDAGYYFIPSWEDFAVDMRDMIITRIPKPYYMHLLELKYVYLQVGSLTIDANGSLQAVDVAPQILNDRTMTPPRYTHEALGDAVDFNDETRAVLIVRTA